MTGYKLTLVIADELCRMVRQALKQQPEGSTLTRVIERESWSGQNYIIFFAIIINDALSMARTKFPHCLTILTLTVFLFQELNLMLK